MYKGIVKKSRTLDAAALISIFGVLEMNLPLVRDQLGDYYGWVFIGVGVLVAYLRTITKGPMGQK